METANQKKSTIKGERPKHAGGAPKKRVKKESGIRVRLTATEKFLIENKAKSAGLRPSAWFRAAAKNAKVTPRMTVEELRLLRVLTGLANNLNQLTKLAHKDGLLTIAGKCREILNEINSYLNYLNNHDGESHQTR